MRKLGTPVRASQEMLGKLRASGSQATWDPGQQARRLGNKKVPTCRVRETCLVTSSDVANRRWSQTPTVTRNSLYTLPY